MLFCNSSNKILVNTESFSLFLSFTGCGNQKFIKFLNHDILKEEPFKVVDSCMIFLRWTWTKLYLKGRTFQINWIITSFSAIRRLTAVTVPLLNTENDRIRLLTVQLRSYEQSRKTFFVPPRGVAGRPWSVDLGATRVRLPVVKFFGYWWSQLCSGRREIN